MYSVVLIQAPWGIGTDVQLSRNPPHRPRAVQWHVAAAGRHQAGKSGLAGPPALAPRCQRTTAAVAGFRQQLPFFLFHPQLLLSAALITSPDRTAAANLFFFRLSSPSKIRQSSILSTLGTAFIRTQFELRHLFRAPRLLSAKPRFFHRRSSPGSASHTLVELDGGIGFVLLIQAFWTTRAAEITTRFSRSADPFTHIYAVAFRALTRSPAGVFLV